MVMVRLLFWQLYKRRQLLISSCLHVVALKNSKINVPLNLCNILFKIKLFKLLGPEDVQHRVQRKFKD